MAKDTRGRNHWQTKTGGHDIEECNELKKLRSKVFFKGTPNY